MLPTMSYTEVADTLENFANGTGGPWDWDNYMSATVFHDAYLEEIQLRMVHLSDEFPAPKGQGFCSSDGIEVIRDYVRELRRRAASASSASVP
jgi:hypothetical protein